MKMGTYNKSSSMAEIRTKWCKETAPEARIRRMEVPLGKSPLSDYQVSILRQADKRRTLKRVVS